jgi:hypothetical protein
VRCDGEGEQRLMRLILAPLAAGDLEETGDSILLDSLAPGLRSWSSLGQTAGIPSCFPHPPGPFPLFPLIQVNGTGRFSPWSRILVEDFHPKR